MAETFVELGAEAVHHLTERHWDRGWDKFRQVRGKKPLLPADSTTSVSRKSNRHRNHLPSPERERDRVVDGSYFASERGHPVPGEEVDERSSLESRTTERVTTAYENETDDPVRPVDPQLERQRTKSSTMSAANGYADEGRARSQQPPRSRYYDDDSDYDEREGRRYRNGNGRGYDDDNYREIIETERYRGPVRPPDVRRHDSYGPRAYDNSAPYGASAGAVAPYRRSANDISEVAPRRSRSRGRYDRYDRDYDRDDRSYSGSRSRSRSRGRSWEEKIGDTFSTSMQGIGAGLVGAVAGGMAGRQFGNRHKERDAIIGAIIGGLGANAVEKQWAKRKERRDEREDERWDEKYGDGDKRRARSNVR